MEFILIVIGRLLVLKSNKMAEFNIALQKTFVYEGGYSNDPDDLGGETYKGISRASHLAWKGWFIIDKYKDKSGFPVILDRDIELQKQVELFYLYEFWLPLKADQIKYRINYQPIQFLILQLMPESKHVSDWYNLYLS